MVSRPSAVLYLCITGVLLVTAVSDADWGRHTFVPFDALPHPLRFSSHHDNQHDFFVMPTWSHKSCCTHVQTSLGDPTCLDITECMMQKLPGMIPDIFFSVFLLLPCALWHVSKGWSIPISCSWWTSTRPKRSTSFSLNCEFRRLMSRGKRLSARLCRSSRLLNCMCWLYTRGERAEVAWGPADMRAALNSTNLVFRYDCLLAAPFSSARVLGKFDALPWICSKYSGILWGHVIYGNRHYRGND